MATMFKPDDSYDGTWLAGYQKEYGNNDIGQYCLSIYWSITTITTVGYGDISGTNNYERIFCSIIMVIGVILFNVAQG